jgi:hypothetical protein
MGAPVAAFRRFARGMVEMRKHYMAEFFAFHGLQQRIEMSPIIGARINDRNLHL